MRELLEPRHAVLAGVEAGLHETQRERRHGEHLAAPGDGLFLELGERHNGVHEPHLARLLGVVLPAQEPDLLGLLGPHEAREQTRAVAAVERADARADLAEARVVGGDRQIADQVQDVAAADRVAGDHRDDRLGEAPNLDVKVRDVEAADRCALLDVAGVAAHPLVAAGAKGVGPLAGEDDHADRGVLTGVLEGARKLDDGARPERVSDLGTVDRDLRDASVVTLRVLVNDVREIGYGVVVDGAPEGAHAAKASLCAVIVPYWLVRAARRRPDGIALVSAEGTWTHAQLLEQSMSGAGALATLGAGPGDRVAIELPPGLQFARALHACMLSGAVAVPVDLRLAPAERAARRDRCATVVGEPLGDGAAWDGGAGGHDLGASAVVLYTSGTSAEPKEVELSFGNLLWSALGSAVALGVDERERWLCALPLSHVGGLSILVRAAIYGTTAVVHERFETERVLATLQEEPITVLSLVATTLARLLDGGLEGGGDLRCALTGGGPVPAALLDRAADSGVPVALTYGLTEAASQVTTTPCAMLAAGRAVAGPPLFCTDVRIADDGEILVHGATVSDGCVDTDGWLHTGDLGELDGAGNLAVNGRAADTIVSGGENVAPGEVEAVLESHPAVAEAGVYGRPDEEWGEAICAVVVAREGDEVDADALVAFCAERLARFKAPKRLRVTDRPLPRTASGKLLRRELA